MVATISYTNGANFAVLGRSSALDVTVDMQEGNDTVAWDGSTSFTMVDGGLGSDTLQLTDGMTIDFITGNGTVFKNFEVLKGSALADIVTMSTQFTTVDLGGGNDTFIWTGATNFKNISGGSGIDTLVLSMGTSVDFTKGSGTVFKNFEVLTGSSLEDNVKGSTQFANIDLAQGNDTFIWSGQTKFTSVSGGNDTDTLLFATGLTVDFTKSYGTIFSNFEILTGSTLADNVKTMNVFSTVDLSGGNDIFSWTGETNFNNISGGNGTDTLVLVNGGNLDLTSVFGTKFTSFETLLGSSTNDYIMATTQYSTINLGLGNDTFTWNGISGFKAVDGGNGMDTLVLERATTVDFVSGAGKVFKNFETLTGSSMADIVTASTQFASIDLGIGDDTLIWTGGTKFTSINGGNGTDTLIIGSGAAINGKTTPITINSSNGFNGFENINGSSYADTITVAGGNVKVDGGAGNDVLKGGTGNATLIGGSGNDTLSGGSGSETYIFNNGFGQDTILDMSGNNGDVIKFGAGINKQNLLITKNANDLVLKTTGTDSLTLKNWYTSATNKVNNFTFDDGSTDTISNFSWGSDIITTPGAFDIRFDYSYDKIGFFDATKRQLLEEAASAWETFIHQDFPVVANGQILSITNPTTGVATTVVTDSSYGTADLTIFVGARELGTNILGRAGPCGWYSNDQRYVGSVFQPVAGTLQIDINSNFYYDTTPQTSNDIPSNKIDFLSVAEHEIGHILGLGTAPQWDKLISGTNFVGANTQIAYGGKPVPLNTGLDHFAPNVLVGGIHPLMDPTTGSGAREPITALDVAALKDLGYNV